MRSALEALRYSDTELNAASRRYSVQKATLEKTFRWEELFCSGKHSSNWQRGRYSPTRGRGINHVLQLGQRMFGTTITYLRRLVFQIDELIHFYRRFSKDKEIAGKKLYYGFIRRHP